MSDVYTKEVKSDDSVILNKSNKKKYDFSDKSLILLIPLMIIKIKNLLKII